MEFKPLEERDFPLLLEWLQRPHVKQWWDDGDDTLEKVRQHYTSDPENTKRFLLIQGEPARPSGYFQYYLTAHGVGIDQFLSDESYLGRGLGTEAIRKFVDFVTAKHAPKSIAVDPSPDNRRAIRCYEKVGFRHTKTVPDRQGKLAYMMEILRADNQLLDRTGNQCDR